MYRFIYPNKDSYIFEVNLNDEYNFGADESLILTKDFDVDSLNGVSRILLHFDLSTTSQSIVSGDISTDAQYYLRLYEKKSSELSPTTAIEGFPLSQSWVEGSGYTLQEPNSRDGVSWVRTDETFNDTNWVKSDGANDSGSRSVSGGGVWITGSGYQASQSFSYESVDVNMNVTDIVNKWLDGSLTNNGFVIKWSGSFEDSEDKTGHIDYFSKDNDSIFSPKLEIRWDDHVACSGSNTGSLTQLTIDGTKDNYLYMIGLRNEYSENENVKFRVGGRTRYMTKSPSFSKSTTSTFFIPEKSGSYSIVDVATGETIIPFSEYTYLSCDSTSNYFIQNLSSFIINRKYKIKFKLQTDDNKEMIFDNNFQFKVVS